MARVASKADDKIKKCLETQRSFALIAGAGSGKTTSLIDALALVRSNNGTQLRQNGQHVACITYTKRAVGVIKSRLGFDELYLVSTLHSFLWGEIGRFQQDIRQALRDNRLPALIAKAREKDKGGKSKQALRAREQAANLQAQLAELDKVTAFVYEDAPYSDYKNGRLSHDDIVEISAYLLAEKATLRRLIGLRYPYIFVDEAQDTFDGIVSGLNLTCVNAGLPLVGYFGDPWQQIYEGRAGTFAPPMGGETITKTENFRCSISVIKLLNAFRDDVEQYPAGENSTREGNVLFQLIQSEEPALPRNKYSEEQIDRALARMDRSLSEWGWRDNGEVVQLYLVRQMIARRMGFPALNQLFTSEFASTRAQEAYEEGEHFLLKPFTETVWPLISAFQAEDQRSVINLLRRNSVSFSIDGPNKDRSLLEMINQSKSTLTDLCEKWKSGVILDILKYCRDQKLLRMPERLLEHLDRPKRTEEYNEDIHGAERADWLCDSFFAMEPVELPAYCNFILNNSAYSTQHGVKGEEYKSVLVVFDDVEASWNNYNFSKLLTPNTAGEPTEGQRERGRKLAYVCFSRAVESLRVLLFTPNPDAARQELLDRHLLSEDQIQIVRI